MDLDSARNVKAEILAAGGVRVSPPAHGALKADAFGIGTATEVASHLVKRGIERYRSSRGLREDKAYRTRTGQLNPNSMKSSRERPNRLRDDPLPFAIGIQKGRFGSDARIVLIGRDARLQTHPMVLRAMSIAAGEAVFVLEDEPQPFSYWQPARRRPLELGTSISSGANPVGTLGAFVTMNDGETCVLSCSHVLAPPRRALLDGIVIQPGSRDGGGESDAIGSLKHVVPLTVSGVNMVDCAVARLAYGLDPTAMIATNGGQPSIRLRGVAQHELNIDDRVMKAGRTTGLTRGRVFAVEVDNYMVNMGSRVAPMLCRFNNQIQVRAEADGSAFAAKGDSGSLLLDEAGFAHGMLFSGSTASNRNRVALTNFNSIHAVLEELDADLFVG